MTDARTLPTLIRTLRERGVRLRAHDGRLKVRGRREALPSALCQAIHSQAATLLPILDTWGPATGLHVLYLLYEAVPSAPFQLDQARFVADPVAFLVRLYQDVQAGPRGPRARTGALQEDLALLYGLGVGL